MFDDTGDEPGAGTQLADATGEQDGSGDAGAPLFTQDRVNRIVADERRRREAAERDASETRKRLEALETEQEQRRQAEMTELERTREVAQRAEEQRLAAEAELQSSRAETLRATMIAANATDLPPAFRARVVGNDADAVKASIEEQRAEYRALQTEMLRGLAGKTAEALTQEFGEDGAALLRAFGGRVPSIGSPSTPGGTQPSAPQTWAEGNRSPAAWADERKRRGVGEHQPLL